MDAPKLPWTNFSTIAQSNCNVNLLTQDQTLSRSAPPSNYAASSKNKSASFLLDCKRHFNSTHWTTGRARNRCRGSASEPGRSKQEFLARDGKSKMAWARHFVHRQMVVRVWRAPRRGKPPERTPWNSRMPHSRLPAPGRQQTRALVQSLQLGMAVSRMQRGTARIFPDCVAEGVGFEPTRPFRA